MMLREWWAASLRVLFVLALGATHAFAGSGNAQCTGPAEALVFSGGRALVTDQVSAVTPHHCWTLTVPANSFVWAYAEPLTDGASLQVRLLTRNPNTAFPPPSEIEAHTAPVPVIPARPFAVASALYVQVSREVVTTHYRLYVFITSSDVGQLFAVSGRLRPAPSAGVPPDLLLPVRVFGHAETSAASEHGLRLRAGETVSLVADGRPVSLSTGERRATGVRVRLEVYAPDGSFVVRPPVSEDRVAGTFTASMTGLYRLHVLQLSFSNGSVRLLAARSGVPPGSAISDLSLELTDPAPQFDGGPTTHVYRVRNLGAATVSGAGVEMPLFANFVNARGLVGAASVACASGHIRELRCVLPPLPPGGTVDVTVVHDPADRFVDAQRVLPVITLDPSGTTYDSRLENDGTTVTVQPWIAARAAAQVTSALPGGSVTLSVAAVNEAPPASVDHQTAVVIEYPTGAVPGTLPFQCLQEAARLRCRLTVRGNGSAPPLAVPFQVGGGLLPGTALPFTATLTSEHPENTFPPDRSPGNDVVTAIATVLAAPSLTDTDGDTLSDLYEQAWGLDPTSPNGDHGPHGDPDGDGRTNVQELADATHPRGTTRLYFAEGSTGAFFDQRLALFNTGTTAARVLVRYLRPAPASPVNQPVTLPGLTRVTLDLETIAGVENTAVSAVVEADQSVVADRTMSWDARGYGAHAETAVSAPRTTWYFAEGSTAGSFSLFYLLQNPGPTAATVQVRYLRPAPLPALTRSYTVEPNSRFNVWVNQEGADLASTDVSAVIESSVPIIAERAMYLDGAGLAFRAGHDAVGIAAPALEWLLAEGATGPFFDLFVLLANPNATDAQAEVRFLLPDGREVVRTRTIPANSRSNIWVDFEAPELADTAVSTSVRSTNGVPLLVERAMWWPGDASTWYEAHASAGVTSAATRWALAEGETGGPRGVSTYVLIANTASADQDVRVALYPEGGAPVERVFRVLARSRFNVDVAAEFPGLATARFGTVVTATLPSSIIVERAMYWDAAGGTWDAGTNAVAMPIP